MPQILFNIWAVTSFIRHGHCYLWNSRLVWLHIASDSLIALAYYSIPITLVYFVRKRSDLPYPLIFLLFGAFIISCGTTHLMEIWTLWHPNYWESGTLKAVTALISFYTAIALIPIVPKALALPSPTQLEKEIAERKRIEKELKESEERWQLALRGNNDGIWDWNIKTNEVFFSTRWKEMLGYEENEIANRFDEWKQRIHPDDRDETTQIIQDHFEKKTPFYISEHRVQCKDGTYKWILDRGQVLWDERGNPVRMVGSHTDISERKQAEDALRNSQLLLDGVLKSSLDGVMAFESVRDCQGKIIDFRWLLVNPAAEHIVGRTSEALIGKHLLEELPGNREEGLFDLYVRVVETGEPIEREFYYEYDGIKAWFQNTAVKLSDGFTVTFRDISERKRVEEAMRDSQERFRLAFEDAAIGMTLVSPDGYFMKVNRTLCEIVGYSEEELQARTFQSITHPDDLDSDLAYVRQVLCGEIRTYQMEKRYFHKKGHIVWILLNVSLVRSDRGQPLYFIAQIQDITPRQQAEERLLQSEERYRLIVEDRTELIARFDCNDRLTFVNQAYCRYFCKKTEELIGNTYNPVIFPEDRETTARHLDTLILDNPVGTIEHRVIVNGEVRWMQWINRIIFDGKGNFVEFQSVGRDISDRKQAEEKIATSLQEKEVMLKEIHHRVKNNLQVICSLLNLQSRSLKDPIITEIFKETQNRVKSMALIHEKLYQSDNLSKIYLADYIRDLANNLLRSYPVESSKITLQTALDNNLVLDIDTAVPCGLIVNELISNAIKYAFTPKQKGVIDIEARSDEEGSLILVIADNGKGMPLDFNLEKTQTLGLKLVKNLIDQLRGMLQLESDRGTRFIITLTRIKN